MKATAKAPLAGRPTRDGAAGNTPCNITIDQNTYAILHRIGKGNVSLGVRLAARHVHSTKAYSTLHASLIR